jgi:hypothetical protein
VAYLVEDEIPGLPAQMCGALFYIRAAAHIIQVQLIEPARLHAVYGALRAALETEARGMLERSPRTGQAWPASSFVSYLKSSLYILVTATLRDEAGLMLRMRLTCGLSPAEETALRQLAERHKAWGEPTLQELWMKEKDTRVELQQAAAADAARHGLRRCALPSCDAQEPHPKLFKLCGRCNAAAYCCKEHQTEDWKRHKRENCKAAR